MKRGWYKVSVWMSNDGTTMQDVSWRPGLGLAMAEARLILERGDPVVEAVVVYDRYLQALARLEPGVRLPVYATAEALSAWESTLDLTVNDLFDLMADVRGKEPA